MEDELVTLSKDEVQMAINAANLDADSDYQSKQTNALIVL